ncbi:MAG: hypothetical protein WCF84_15175, partial [Anaerolineae bacterium]
NDDRMNQTVYANHLLWAGVNTGLYQQFSSKTEPEYHAGIAWFAVRPQWTTTCAVAPSGGGGGLCFVPTMARQGYVAVQHEDAIFPSIGMTDAGMGAMAFSVTGADMYPSSGYVRLGTAYGPGNVQMSAQGMGSLQDFSWYLNGRPRWGDYSAAVASGTHIYFASEYIQYPDCDLATFTVDHTCGGTRGTRTNWGTSISKMLP